MAVAELLEPDTARTGSTCDPADVLVVIPTLDEAAHIETCLRSLVAGDPFAAGVRIVVVDGGSDDGTRAIVRRLCSEMPGLTLIANPARLQSAGINTAVEAAGEGRRYLLRCDAHADYPAGYLRRLAEALHNRPEAASIASVLDATGDGCFQRASAWVVDTPLGSGGSAHRGGLRSGWVDHGHHAGFRLDWFRRIGGYDAGFSHNEDAEYDHRLALAGGRVWLEASLRTGYHVRPTARGLWQQYWRYGRGRARTIAKHGMRPRLRQMVPVANVALLAVSILISPLFPVALVVPGLYLALLSIVSLVGAARLRSVCGLWAGPVLFIMHNAWGAGFLWQQIARSS